MGGPREAQRDADARLMGDALGADVAQLATLLGVLG
jgi:hypothetical protein